MKYLFSIFLFLTTCFPAICQLDGLWTHPESERAAYIDGKKIYSQYLDGRFFMVEQKVKFSRNGKLKIQEWHWKIKRKSKDYEGQKWHKGRYYLKNDTLLFMWPNDTSILIKSKYESILDHNVNNHGVKIDLPFASSIRRPDLSGQLRMKIYIGFDSLEQEKIIIDSTEIETKEDFTSLIKHYKNTAHSHQRISAILFCDKNASIEKLMFIEQELLKNDIRTMSYVTKYEGIKPYDGEIRGIGITIIRNDIIVVPD